MNEVIAGIYGTGGHEKVASEGGETISTLSDLAVVVSLELGTDPNDLEKLAGESRKHLDDLVSYDQAGRAAAAAVAVTHVTATDVL